MKKVKRVRKAKKARMRKGTLRLRNATPKGRHRGNTVEIEQEAMEIPFVRTLSEKDPGLGRVLRYYYTLGARSVR